MHCVQLCEATLCIVCSRVPLNSLLAYLAAVLSPPCCSTLLTSVLDQSLPCLPPLTHCRRSLTTQGSSGLHCQARTTSSVSQLVSTSCVHVGQYSGHSPPLPLLLPSPPLPFLPLPCPCPSQCRQTHVPVCSDRW